MKCAGCRSSGEVKWLYHATGFLEATTNEEREAAMARGVVLINYLYSTREGLALEQMPLRFVKKKTEPPQPNPVDATARPPQPHPVDATVRRLGHDGLYARDPFLKLVWYKTRSVLWRFFSRK